MFPQSHDAAIVDELFHESNIDIRRSSVVYDKDGWVTKLSLIDAALDQSSFFVFPTAFDQLTHLRELYISASLSTFPAGLCQLPNLQVLVFSGPTHPEAFPSDLVRLRPTLRYLGLGNLRLGDIPSAVWQLRELRVLDLSGNDLTYLSPEIGQLAQLRLLYLYDNRLLQLPEEIGQMTQLEEFGFWPHALQTLPEEITRLHHLYELELSRTLFEHADLPRMAQQMGMVLSQHPLAPSLRRVISSPLDLPPYPCTCCGYLTLQEGERECEICPVCFWQADAMQRLSPSVAIGPNYVSLFEARLNFARMGATDDQVLRFVRPPLPEEIPDERRRVPYMDFDRFFIKAKKPIERNVSIQ